MRRPHFAEVLQRNWRTAACRKPALRLWFVKAIRWGNVMKTELSLTLATIIATLPLLAAHGAQTLNFGPSLPTGTVPDGYAGFDWHGAQNDVFADTTPSFFGSLFITEFSRAAPFDLNSMVVQELNSDAPSIGETSNNTTTIFGYLNGTLVRTLTENYAFGGGTALTLNMDDVNDVKFETTNVRTVFGQPVIISEPDLTLVSQLTVDNVAAKAPEISPTTAASALTLLIGALIVITGRRGSLSGRSVRAADAASDRASLGQRIIH